MSQEIKINGLQQQRLNSGIFFKNARKEKENHPDFKGAMNCEGKDFEISLWIKKTSKGDAMFTFTIKEPWVKGQQSANPAETTIPVVKAFDMFDDDFPI